MTRTPDLLTPGEQNGTALGLTGGVDDATGKLAWWLLLLILLGSLLVCCCCFFFACVLIRRKREAQRKEVTLTLAGDAFGSEGSTPTSLPPLPRMKQASSKENVIETLTRMRSPSQDGRTRARSIDDVEQARSLCEPMHGRCELGAHTSSKTIDVQSAQSAARLQGHLSSKLGAKGPSERARVQPVSPRSRPQYAGAQRGGEHTLAGGGLLSETI